MTWENTSAKDSFSCHVTTWLGSLTWSRLKRKEQRKDQVAHVRKSSHFHICIWQNTIWTVPQCYSHFSDPETYATCWHLSKGQKIHHGGAYVQNCHIQIYCWPKTEKGQHHDLPCEILHQIHIKYVQFGVGILKQWPKQNLSRLKRIRNWFKSIWTDFAKPKKEKGAEPSGLVSATSGPCQTCQPSLRGLLRVEAYWAEPS